MTKAGARADAEDARATGRGARRMLMRMSDSLIGTVVAARYRVEERVAGGASAWVYRAIDLPTGAMRALKVLTEAASPELQARFADEMELLRRLRHPYIVQVHAVGVIDDLPYMVMDFVEGGSVLALRNEDGPLLLEDAASLGVQVLSALAEAHANGIVHRDVKPGNVLVDDAGNARLCDFGVARYHADARTRLTATGSSLGTLLYMAPEQRVDAHRADLTSDLYSVGTLLYRLLSDATPVDLFTAGRDDPRWEELPEAARDVVFRATRATREERWPNARAMAEALLYALPTESCTALLASPGGDPAAFRPPAAAVRPQTGSSPADRPPDGLPEDAGSTSVAAWAAVVFGAAFAAGFVAWVSG